MECLAKRLHSVWSVLLSEHLQLNFMNGGRSLSVNFDPKDRGALMLTIVMPIDTDNYCN